MTNPDERPRTPCQNNPAGWDIPVPSTDGAAREVRRNVRRALSDCGTCWDRTGCLERAYATPPRHRCVLAGRVWSGRDSSPLPLGRWRVVARREDLLDEATR